MLIRQLFEAETSTYTYLVADPNSGAAALIDPVLEKMDDYRQLLRELDLHLELCIDTHTHADHVTALGALRDELGCRSLVGEQSLAKCASGTYQHGDELPLGPLRIQVLHTPGHTDDSYCFYIADGDQGYLFTGDTLLIRGTGRTDFQNGDATEQYRSLHQRLLTLPDNTVVFPGHDYRGWSTSTIAEERANNPRLQIPSAEAYAAFMANLHLPNPKMMDIAVPRNQACGNG